MKTFKRSIWIFIAVAMLTGVFASCSPKPDNDGGGNGTTDITGTPYESYSYDVGVDKNSPLITIVENKSSDYTIIIPQESEQTDAFGARELQDYLYSATGARLSLGYDSDIGINKFISVGKTAQLAQNIDFDYSTITDDGFFIKTSGGNVYIDANIGRGTVYGCYEFLERFIGLRFLTPAVTHFEHMDTLKIHSLNIVQSPEFAMRTWYSGEVYNANFAMHTRMYSDWTTIDTTKGYDSPWFKGLNTVHNSTDGQSSGLPGYVNKSEWGATHPEWFTDYTNKTTYYDVDYTNGITDDGKIDESMEESVFKVFLSRLKEFTEQDREAQYFMIGRVDDRKALCMSETAIRRREMFTEAGISVIFMNLLAENINDWLAETQDGRQITLVMFAYQMTVVPPVKEVNGKFEPISPLVIARDDVAIRLAPIEADYTFSFNDERQNESKQNLDNWIMCGSKFMVWDYVINFTEYLWYWPNIHYIKENLEFYKQSNIIYVMNQSAYNSSNIWQDHLRYYVASKLYWNLGWDVEYLVNEFLELYFGVGAKYVKGMMDLYDNHFFELRESGDFNLTIMGENRQFLDAEYYPIAFLEGCLNIIQNGIASIAQDTTIGDDTRYQAIARLEAVSLTPRMMILVNYESYYLTGKLEFAIELFDIVDRMGGLRTTGEPTPLASAKAKYGVN